MSGEGGISDGDIDGNDSDMSSEEGINDNIGDDS